MSNSLYSDVSLLVESLREDLRELSETLQGIDVVQSVCYTLPPSHGDMAGNNDWHLIEPKVHSGFPALSLATEAFERLTPDYEHSAKYPFRLPGIIQMHPMYSFNISQLIDRINMRKSLIKEIINSSSLNPGAKRELVQSICPNAITLQIYRLIKYDTAPVKRVGFTWCNKNSMQTIEKSVFLKYLNGSKENPPAGQTKADWSPFVEREIEAVKSLNGECVRIKRPLPVVPKLNVSFTDETKTVMFYGHLPTIVFGEEPAKISPLKSYVSDNNNKQLMNYLIKRLYVVDNSNLSL